ncbi:MAG: methionine biosynthesis protein MetW [Alphaproteobacteria bacterium]|nr:methionine biosynthesis protein MetW [Alphaproteobacteria bacterium]
MRAPAPRPDARRPSGIRVDLRIIADMIEPSSRVLDIGCGDGQLLRYLVQTRNVVGRGIELSQVGVNASVAQGLSVVQGDADSDLSDYPTQAFDYVVLSQTLQATRNPRRVVSELVRIGRKAIISFPNFGFWRVRLRLLFDGRMPKTGALEYEWHETPNIHLCTILDFVDLCDRLGAKVERRISLTSGGRTSLLQRSLHVANLFGEQAVFLVSRPPDAAGATPT